MLALACALAAPAAAHADPDAAGKAKAIDVKPMLDKLDVYRDELGNVYVLPRPGTVDFDAAGEWVFYGDGKTLYQQRIIGGSDNAGKSFEFALWAPRARANGMALIQAKDDHLELICRDRKDGTRPLTQLKADEARTLLQRTKLLPPLWHRQSHLLARDDDGVYYYVDKMLDDYGGHGFRVFVGQKGAMKEMPMTNVVSDSAGEIFATKSGQLKLVGGKGGTMYWIKGGKKSELTQLETSENIYLIYRDLGIYGPLGAVCDDL